MGLKEWYGQKRFNKPFPPWWMRGVFWFTRERNIPGVNRIFTISVNFAVQGSGGLYLKEKERERGKWIWNLSFHFSCLLHVCIYTYRAIVWKQVYFGNWRYYRFISKCTSSCLYMVCMHSCERKREDRKRQKNNCDKYLVKIMQSLCKTSSFGCFSTHT